MLADLIAMVLLVELQHILGLQKSFTAMHFENFKERESFCEYLKPSIFLNI
jgi:hypothetical protein